MQPPRGRWKNRGSSQELGTGAPPAVWFQTSLYGHVALGPRVLDKAGHRSALQFSGLWYVVSMVSDCKVFLGKKDHLLMSSRTIRAMPGGNLSVHMEFPR